MMARKDVSLPAEAVSTWLEAAKASPAVISGALSEFIGGITRWAGNFTRAVLKMGWRQKGKVLLVVVLAVLSACAPRGAAPGVGNAGAATQPVISEGVPSQTPPPTPTPTPALQPESPIIRFFLPTETPVPDGTPAPSAAGEPGTPASAAERYPGQALVGVEVTEAGLASDFEAASLDNLLIAQIKALNLAYYPVTLDGKPSFPEKITLGDGGEASLEMAAGEPVYTDGAQFYVPNVVLPDGFNLLVAVDAENGALFFVVYNMDTNRITHMAPVIPGEKGYSKDATLEFRDDGSIVLRDAEGESPVENSLERLGLDKAGFAGISRILDYFGDDADSLPVVEIFANGDGFDVVVNAHNRNGDAFEKTVSGSLFKAGDHVVVLDSNGVPVAAPGQAENGAPLWYVVETREEGGGKVYEIGGEGYVVANVRGSLRLMKYDPDIVSYVEGVWQLSVPDSVMDNINLMIEAFGLDENDVGYQLATDQEIEHLKGLLDGDVALGEHVWRLDAAMENGQHITMFADEQGHWYGLDHVWTYGEQSDDAMGKPPEAHWEESAFQIKSIKEGTHWGTVFVGKDGNYYRVDDIRGLIKVPDNALDAEYEAVYRLGLDALGDSAKDMSVENIVEAGWGEVDRIVKDYLQYKKERGENPYVLGGGLEPRGGVGFVEYGSGFVSLGSDRIRWNGYEVSVVVGARPLSTGGYGVTTLDLGYKDERGKFHQFGKMPIFGPRTEMFLNIDSIDRGRFRIMADNMDSFELVIDMFDENSVGASFLAHGVGPSIDDAIEYWSSMTGYDPYFYDFLRSMYENNTYFSSTWNTSMNFVDSMSMLGKNDPGFSVESFRGQIPSGYVESVTREPNGLINSITIITNDDILTLKSTNEMGAIDDRNFGLVYYAYDEYGKKIPGLRFVLEKELH